VTFHPVPGGGPELYQKATLVLNFIGLGITASAIMQRNFTAFPFHLQTADTDHAMGY
jgi:hypothetical protein